MKKSYLKPRQGLRVRRPEDGSVLPTGGAWVVMSPYWRRRLADGDVTEGRPRPAAKKDQQKEAE